MTVWLNGALCEAEAARIDPADRGFTLGDGVFETVRAVQGRPAHLERHLARLRDGAGVLGIVLPWSDGAISEAVASVLSATGLGDAAVRVTLTRGPAGRGVLPPENASPTLLIGASPLPSPLPPAHVVIARSTCRNEASPLSRIKSLNYLDSILARREAAERGADDALLLDTRGRLAEATAATLFVLGQGVVATPPTGDGALPGILRGRLLESGAVVERTLRPGNLLAANAAFLANSLGVREVASVEGQTLRRDGALVERLRGLL